MDQVLFFYILLTGFFFVTSLLSSSVGLSGTMIFLVALNAFEITNISTKPTAFLCSLIVGLISFFIYYRNQKDRMRKTITFLIPTLASYFLFSIITPTFDISVIFVGIGLFILGTYLFFNIKKKKREYSDKLNQNEIIYQNILGFIIGAVSGVFHLYGALLIIPILHVITWDRTKYILAVGSLFCVIQATIELGIHYMKEGIELEMGYTIPLLNTVLLGALIGSKINARFYNTRYIRRTTGLIVLLSGIFMVIVHSYRLFVK